MSDKTFDIEAEVTRLTALANKLKVRESSLDEHIHDLASSMASDANNGGVSEQIRFLLTHWGESAQIEVERIITDEAE